MTIDNLIGFLEDLIDDDNCDKEIDWLSLDPNEGFEIYYKDNTYKLLDFENGKAKTSTAE